VLEKVYTMSPKFQTLHMMIEATIGLITKFKAFALYLTHTFGDMNN